MKTQTPKTNVANLTRLERFIEEKIFRLPARP